MLHHCPPLTVARRALGRALLLTIALVLSAALVGCATEQRSANPTPYLPEPVQTEAEDLPSYAELAQRYNANVEKLDRLRASTVVAMRWTDEEGERHYEQGEGLFLFMQPERVTLTVGKLGDAKLWAGANAERYWMFDLRDSGTAYVGAHENVGKPCVEQLPLPVNPRAVPYLLGLLPLDESLADMAPPVEELRGHYLIEPPGVNVRMLLHPETALPVRVDLTDEQGRSAIVALLEDYGTVEQEGVGTDASARIPQRAAFHALDNDAELTLHLSDATDGRRFDTIKDEMFDFDAILADQEPAEVVNLDEPCDEDGQTPNGGDEAEATEDAGDDAAGEDDA